MNVQGSQNVSFGSIVSINYSKKSASLHPEVEKLATRLRKIGSSNVKFDIIARKDFVNLKVFLGNLKSDNYCLGEANFKGKQILKQGSLIRFAMAKRFIQMMDMF